MAAVTLVLAVAFVWWLASGRGGDSVEVAQADLAGQDSATGARARASEHPQSGKLDLAGAPKAAVSGTIRERAGKPIAGAQVCAFADRDERRGLGEERARCARSGPDGHYRIEGLWPVKTEIHASAATFKPGQWERRESDGRRTIAVSLRAGQATEAVDVELEPGGVLLRGVVKDIAGGEIERAQVSIRPDFRARTRGIAVESSGDDGRFEMWVAPGQVNVLANAAGYAPGRVAAVAPGEFVELFLTPESVLIGKVVLASDGAPVEGVVVSPGGGRWGGAINGGSRTDADGRFRIIELEPGTYKPTARGDEVYGQLAEQVHLGLGETSEEVVIRVHPAVTVEADIVIAGSPKRPCLDGSVRLQTEGENGAHASVDDEGHVELRGVLADEYEVRVVCEGTVSADSYAKLVVGTDNIAGLVWEVSEGLAIRGEVVDEAGQPLAHVSVRASPVVDREAARAQVTDSHGSSEDDGSFELAGLLPGRYEVSISAWRSRPGPREPVTVELEAGADVNGVRIVMPAVGMVRGRVVDEAGAPVSGANLQASLIVGKDAAQGRSNDAGEFELADLRPGSTRVVANHSGGWWGGAAMRKPGSTDDDLQGEVVEVVANEVVEVVLTVESRDGRITGVVTDEGGGPVADAFIDVERTSEKAGTNASIARRSVRWSWGRQPALTDPDGRFELDGLSDGSYVVRANRKGGGEAIATDVPVGSHVALVITTTGELAGTVRLADGGAPDRFTLTIEDKANGVSLRDSFFRTEGAWRITQVPAGTFEIVATAAEGTATLEPEVELGEGEVREGIELTLAPRLTLRGRIVDLETREPVAGLSVSVSGAGNFGRFGPDGGEHLNVSGPDGTFEVKDAPTGAVYLMAMNQAAGSKAKYDSLWQPLTLEPSPRVQDLGEVEVVAKRLEPSEKPGDLGYQINGWNPTQKPEDYEATVALVRPGGPAEGTGLAAGDVIEKVQGYEVLGTQGPRYQLLTRLPEGSKLTLTLRGGKTVNIVVGPPL